MTVGWFGIGMDGMRAVGGGPRGTSFFPRRAARGHEERQRQHLFVHEGPRRATKNGNGNTLLSTNERRTTKNGNGNTLLSTKGRKGHEGPRRTATATPFCPRRAAKGHEGPRRTATATPFCPRRAAKKTLNPLIHEGMQRAAKNNSLIYWGVALYVGTGIAVRDVRGAEGDLTRPIFAAMMERGGYGVGPTGSRSDGVDGLAGEDE